MLYRPLASPGLRMMLMLVLMLTMTGCAILNPQTQSVSQRNLQLVVTDLVSAMSQVRRLSPSTTTLQFVEPDTEFGTLLLSTLRNAGYGIQMVNSVRDNKFVSYALRSSETDAGLVNDYLIRIDEVEMRREYNTTRAGIFPASLLFVSGLDKNDRIVLNNDIFAEQGGDQTFLSGVEGDHQSIAKPGEVREVIADNNTLKAAGSRTDQSTVLADARREFLESERQYESTDLADKLRYRRLVIMFPDNQSLQMGTANKLAIRNLVSDFQANDVFKIQACYDFDGVNERAERRSIRVKEEIVSHGIPSSAVFRAPCTRTDFRHHSDDSPTPVAVVQFRNR